MNAKVKNKALGASALYFPSLYKHIAFLNEIFSK